MTEKQPMNIHQIINSRAEAEERRREQEWIAANNTVAQFAPIRESNPPRRSSERLGMGTTEMSQPQSNITDVFIARPTQK